MESQADLPAAAFLPVGIVLTALGVLGIVWPDSEYWFRTVMLGQARPRPTRWGRVAGRLIGAVLVAIGVWMITSA